MKRMPICALHAGEGEGRLPELRGGGHRYEGVWDDGREKHDRSCDHGAGGKERITADFDVISLDAAEHM